MKRKTYVILLAFVLVLMTAMPVFAADNKSDQGSLPPEMDQEEMTIKIFDFANTFKDQFPRELKMSDIDLSKAYKIYVETNIFAIDTNDFGQVAGILEKEAEYIFEVPIFFENGDVYIANLQINFPLPENARDLLTDEQIAEYEPTVDHWAVSAMFQYLEKDTPFTDYYERVRSSIDETGEKPLLVGSLPYFRRAVALFPGEDGNIERLIPLDKNTLDWYGLERFQKEYDANGWLDYSAIKEYIGLVIFVNFAKKTKENVPMIL